MALRAQENRTGRAGETARTDISTEPGQRAQRAPQKGRESSPQLQQQFKGVFVVWFGLNKQLESWEKTQSLSWDHPKVNWNYLRSCTQSQGRFGGVRKSQPTNTS